MIFRPCCRILPVASLLAALWSCGPALASVSGGTVAPTGFSAPVGEGPSGSAAGAVDAPVLMAAADCSGAAAQAAADSGGQVLSVSSRQQNGRTVCVVTVLVPGSDGGRPRKQTITLPQ